MENDEEGDCVYVVLGYLWFNGDMYSDGIESKRPSSAAFSVFTALFSVSTLLILSLSSSFFSVNAMKEAEISLAFSYEFSSL